MTSLRRCLREPIREIFDAAQYLDDAVSAHLDGNKEIAADLIRMADMPAIREWTESLWGPKSQHRQYRPVAGAPASLAREKRIPVRMPTTAQKKAILERDGYHCRFCGIPLIRATVRQRIHAVYPEALPWGRTNLTQHAAFQAMWVQYDHLLAHARGGDNSLDNVIVTCGPCNFGRVKYTLEEVGLIDPRTREPIRSNWDGLERFYPLKRAATAPSRRARSTASTENMTQAKFLSITPPPIDLVFEGMIARAENQGLQVVGTAAGLKVHPAGQPAFLYFYPPSMYKQGSSVLEVYLAHLKDSRLAEELRHRVAAVDDVVAKGQFSLRVFVTPDTLANAREVLEIALEVMTRPSTSL